MGGSSKKGTGTHARAHTHTPVGTHTRVRAHPRHKPRLSLQPAGKSPSSCDVHVTELLSFKSDLALGGITSFGNKRKCLHCFRQLVFIFETVLQNNCSPLWKPRASESASADLRGQPAMLQGSFHRGAEGSPSNPRSAAGASRPRDPDSLPVWCSGLSKRSGAGTGTSICHHH